MRRVTSGAWTRRQFVAGPFAAALFAKKECPAGRASYAECGHFVTGISLRLALPLVAIRSDLLSLS
jgi:hypothetical protein